MSSKMQKWDPQVYDEVFGAVLFLGLAEGNIRRPVSGRVSATDATVTKMGACSADVPRDLARFLYRRAEKKGESVRLDWDADEPTLNLFHARWLPLPPTSTPS